MRTPTENAVQSLLLELAFGWGGHGARLSTMSRLCIELFTSNGWMQANSFRFNDYQVLNARRYL